MFRLLKNIRKVRETKVQMLVMNFLGIPQGNSHQKTPEEDLEEIRRYMDLYAPLFRTVIKKEPLVTLLMLRPNYLARQVLNQFFDPNQE